MTTRTTPTLISDPASPSATSRRISKTVSSILWFLIALVITVTFVFPMYFMVISSFKPEKDVLSTNIELIPSDFQGLKNYQRAFEVVPMARFFFNSVLMAVTDVIVTVFFSALAGYGFAKYKFRGRNLLFGFILVIMSIPFQILLVPLFIEVRSLGWDNTYQGLIIPGIMNAFGVFMMRQFAFSIPDDLLDAARIDGAGEFRIFLRVAFPLLASASASLAIIIFLWSWNNFLWPLIIIKDQSLAPIQVGITAFTQAHSAEPQWAVAMAVSTLATLPIAALFIFFQRYFIAGVMMSGIKG